MKREEEEQEENEEDHHQCPVKGHMKALYGRSYLNLGKVVRLYREEGGVVHPSLTVFIVLHCTTGMYTAMPPVLLSENCCIL